MGLGLGFGFGLGLGFGFGFGLGFGLGFGFGLGLGLAYPHSNPRPNPNPTPKYAPGMRVQNTTLSSSLAILMYPFCIKYIESPGSFIRNAWSPLISTWVGG